MEELLPCPFCGGEAKIEDWIHVWEYGTIIKCVVCGARISEGLEDGNGWHERAVEKWNRRAQPGQPEAVHGQWKTVEVYSTTARYRCTACEAEMIDCIDRKDRHRYCHNCGAKMDGARQEGETHE